MRHHGFGVDTSEACRPVRLSPALSGSAHVIKPHSNSMLCCCSWLQMTTTQAVDSVSWEQTGVAQVLSPQMLWPRRGNTCHVLCPRPLILEGVCGRRWQRWHIIYCLIKSIWQTWRNAVYTSSTQGGTSAFMWSPCQCLCPSDKSELNIFTCFTLVWSPTTPGGNIWVFSC